MVRGAAGVVESSGTEMYFESHMACGSWKISLSVKVEIDENPEENN